MDAREPNASSPPWLQVERLAVVGVWAPILLICVWWGAVSLVGAITSHWPGLGFGFGWGAAVGLFFFSFFAAHCLLVAAAVGAFLLASLRASRRFAVTVSMVVGFAGSAVVLLPVYFNVKLL